jgi:hypothetical protein
MASYQSRQRHVAFAVLNCTVAVEPSKHRWCQPSVPESRIPLALRTAAVGSGYSARRRRSLSTARIQCSVVPAIRPAMWHCCCGVGRSAHAVRHACGVSSDNRQTSIVRVVAPCGSRDHYHATPPVMQCKPTADWQLTIGSAVTVYFRTSHRHRPVPKPRSDIADSSTEQSFTVIGARV